MHTPINGAGWKKRLADNAARKESQNDPEILARRQEVQARQEAERAEQMRLTAEADARRQSELVTFPAMSVKTATEVLLAFERYRSAGREATAAEAEAVSRMAQGLSANPGSPVIRATHGLPYPIPASGEAVRAVETSVPHTDPEKLDNVPKMPARKSAVAKVETTSDGFLIDD